MRAIPQYQLILSETARFLCLWGHESALYRGIGQFKRCRVCVSVCAWLFQSMKGLRIRKRPFLRFESLDNEIRNLTFINFAQSYNVGRAITSGGNETSKLEYRITIRYFFLWWFEATFIKWNARFSFHKANSENALTSFSVKQFFITLIL